MVGSLAASQKRSLTVMMGSKMKGVTVVRSSSSETTSMEVEVVTGQVTEVTKDTFWPIVKAAGDKVVVLDMYAQWYHLRSTNRFFVSEFSKMKTKNRISLTSL